MMKANKKKAATKSKNKKGKKAAALEQEQKPKSKTQSEPQQRIPPYIRIEGSWNAPNVVKIVNAHVKVSIFIFHLPHWISFLYSLNVFQEDDAEGKPTAKLTKAAQYIDKEHRNKAAKVGFTSTLSDRYDTQTRDTSWVSHIFCILQPNTGFP